MSAGYSGTPLAKKLGCKPDLRMLAVGMPKSVKDEIGLTFATKGGGPWDVVVQFTTELSNLAELLPGHMASLDKAGMIWVAWPKKSPPKGVAKIETDITEDRIRDVCLPLGLVDVKVCAIDDQWSGLKLVIRKELR